jgi:hypothetical protein
MEIVDLNKRRAMARKILFNTEGHALVNPAGQAVHWGTEHRCLVEFHKLRFKQPVICDEDLERAKVLLKASRWTIRKVIMEVRESA